MLTFGCPFACDFCSKPVFGNRLRRRSVGRVMEEIEAIAGLGYDSLWIADDCLTLDLDYLARFCEALIGRGLGLRWYCLSRVDKMTSEAAALMRRAGCEKVYCGLESGSDRTLRLMGKKATVAEGVRSVEALHDQGLAVGGFFMVGYPGETLESIKSTFALALTLPLDEISFTVPYPLRGSPLHARVQAVCENDDWDWENQVKFLYGTEFDAVWLEKRIQATMRSFRKKKLAPTGCRE